MNAAQEAISHKQLSVPNDLGQDASVEITGELKALLADVFTLYIKTKNFHWHMTGRHFRDYHLLLDEQAEQIFDMTDDIAERARKLGGATLRSIHDIVQQQRLRDNNGDQVDAHCMLLELRADNLQLTGYLRAAHSLCDRHNDVATELDRSNGAPDLVPVRNNQLLNHMARELPLF